MEGTRLSTAGCTWRWHAVDEASARKRSRERVQVASEPILTLLTAPTQIMRLRGAQVLFAGLMLPAGAALGPSPLALVNPFIGKTTH
jgi:hypothetical protein